MPFVMLRNFRKSPLSNLRWDGVVWYSPTIFLGPLANALKKVAGCRSYLILRDIFPDWAVDMDLMNRGLPYQFFKAVERYQYSVADVIGVQTHGNLRYLAQWSSHPDRELEVLQNWLGTSEVGSCSISVKSSQLAGRTIFVYAGNMGVAQGMGVLLDLAERLQAREDIGFLFVGRGSDSLLLREDAKRRELANVAFYDEIEPSEIPGLYQQCDVGIVALDPRHKTHNIPGKFLSYMRAGLPVLASINEGNDLADLIREEKVGRVTTDNSVNTLRFLAEDLVDEIADEKSISNRCMTLSERLFSPKTAVHQIVTALGDERFCEDRSN